jgi:hypothetical protein
MILMFFLQGATNTEPYEEYKLNSNYYISKIDDIVRIDGRIDEEFWKDLDSISDLIQVSPKINSDPSKKTDIKMCYDKDFLYISVRLDQDNISYKNGEYDDFPGAFDSQSDYFIFEVDTFHDHETSYGFAVNSSGIQADYIIYEDEFIDDDWNGLWYSEVKSIEDGWSLEYKIPFNILRFSINEDKIWGVDFIRYIKNNNEYISWVSIPDIKPGLVSHYGHLHGIDITQKKSLQLRFHTINGNTSYDDMYYELYEDAPVGLNLSDGIKNYKNSIYDHNVGFSLKQIINSNSNIDLTINPNYEHVNQDPSEINNTPYETYKEEKRPFFLENEIFFKTPIEIFYSRRVGGIVNTNDDYFISDLKSAIKYTGKSSERSYGLILSYSESTSLRNFVNSSNIYSSIFRFSQKFQNNNIGFIATNNSKENNSSNVYGIDCAFNLINNQLYIDSQVAFSDINNKIGNGYNFNIGYKSNSISMLNKILVLDVWLMNNVYDTNFHISDLGYLFRNNLKERNIGLSISDELGVTKSKYTFQHYLAKNYSNDILSDIKSFEYNILMQNLSFINFGFSSESKHFKDRYYDDYLNFDINKVVRVPNNKTINFGYGNDLRNNLNYEISLKKFVNDLDDNGIQYNIGAIYQLNSWIDINLSYNKLNYDETYHFLKIRQLPNGINIFNGYSGYYRDDYQYLFTNSMNKEIYYTAQISAYLYKIVLQIYSEYFIYQNNWNDDGEIFKIDSNDSDYIYPIPAGFGDALINENDEILYNAYYTSIKLNLVLKWNFINNSNIFFIYSLNKGVNGTRFSNPKDLIEFSNKDDNVFASEIFYDSSFFMKCEFYFKN